ncbi:NAD(P)H-binding [Bacillus sp. OV194]|nr:NAD(P)H-binding [Bacillus sp. OV194]
MGIYDEVSGERYSSILDPYLNSAKIIEASALDYTILRPGWFTNKDEIDYEITNEAAVLVAHFFYFEGVFQVPFSLCMNKRLNHIVDSINYMIL